MKSKDQFLTAYDAGKEAYRTDAAKRPWWNQLIFSVVLIGGLLATEGWLAHQNSALSSGWRFAIAACVACSLAVLCSLALGKLRTSRMNW